MNELLDALRRRHPDYCGPLGARWWRVVRDAVGGTGGFRHAIEHGRTDTIPLGDNVTSPEAPLPGSYLRRFQRETADTFAERQRVSFYRNHVAPIVAQYQGHLWRRSAERESTVPAVTDWWANVDGAGTPAARWLAVGSRRAQHFGWAAAIFDRPATPLSAASARTTARWLQPEELVDWCFADDGALEWARLCTVTMQRDPFGAVVTAEVYTTWTRETWTRHEVVGDKITGGDAVPHALGAVPLALLYWQPPEEPGVLYGTSNIDGSVAAAVELFNVSSEARHIERGTAFPVLYVQGSSPSALEGLKLGVNGGLHIEMGVSMAPGFLEVPGGLNAHFAARRAELRDEVYRSANLDPPQADGTTPESGIARAYKFLPRRSVLVDVCSHLATFERAAVDLLARWDGADPSAWKAATSIVYPSDFDVQDADGTIDRASKVIGASDVPTTKRAARLQLGRAVAPHASAADEAALTAEVDALAARERAALATPDPAVSGARDPARTTGADGGGNGAPAGA